MGRLFGPRVVGRLCLLVIATALSAPSAWTDVKLHGLFTDNMVLQRGKPVPVWGTADEGEEITVKFLQQSKSTTAKGGRWMVTLDPLTAGGPFTLTVTGKNTITLNNVLIGEVWIGSGQSNMAMAVAGCWEVQKDIDNSENPNIRLYSVPLKVSADPLTDVMGSWVECKPETVRGFSAVLYFFGRELQKALGVPVGLIQTAWGGTPVEAWTPLHTLQKLPEAKAILDRYAAALQAYPEEKKKFDEAMAKWREIMEKAKREGLPFAQRQPFPPMGPEHPHSPGGLFNAMIAPLMPYAIAGATWYQGESNAGRAKQYRTLFPAMIRAWREEWKQGDFPFLFVQLAAYMAVEPQPVDSAWAELREAQTMALSLPNTGMVVTTDLGNDGDIHPRRKQEVGARMSLAARAIAYGEKIVYSGPMFDSMQIQGNKAILTFKHVGSGLTTVGDGLNLSPEPTYHDVQLAGLQKRLEEAKAAAAKAPERQDLSDLVKDLEKQIESTRKAAEALVKARKEGMDIRNAESLNSPVKGFAIAGEDRKFYWAHAEIAGKDKVVVYSPKVEQPVAIRFAWENYPICNLYNKEGLPAVPFRTDDFPMITAGKE